MLAGGGNVEAFLSFRDDGVEKVVGGLIN